MKNWNLVKYLRTHSLPRTMIVVTILGNVSVLEKKVWCSKNPSSFVSRDQECYKTDKNFRLISQLSVTPRIKKKVIRLEIAWDVYVMSKWFLVKTRHPLVFSILENLFRKFTRYQCLVIQEVKPQLKQSHGIWYFFSVYPFLGNSQGRVSWLEILPCLIHRSFTVTKPSYLSLVGQEVKSWVFQFLVHFSLDLKPTNRW